MMSTTRKTLAEMHITEQRLKALASRPDSSIDYSDIPKLDDNFWKTAKVHNPAKQKTK